MMYKLPHLINNKQIWLVSGKGEIISQKTIWCLSTSIKNILLYPHVHEHLPPHTHENYNTHEHTHTDAHTYMQECHLSIHLNDM